MILKDHPYFAAAVFYKGLARFRQKDIEGAAEYFKRALEVYPDHQKARKGLDNVTKQFLNAGNKSYKRGDITKELQNKFQQIISGEDVKYHSWLTKIN